MNQTASPTILSHEPRRRCHEDRLVGPGAQGEFWHREAVRDRGPEQGQAASAQMLLHPA